MIGTPAQREAKAETSDESRRPRACHREEVAVILRRVAAAMNWRRRWLEHLFRAEEDARLDSPAAQRRWLCGQDGYRCIEELERELYGVDGTFCRIRDRFGLSRLDCDVLQLCFALAISPLLQKSFFNLKRLISPQESTASIAGRLFGHGRTPYLPADSPLLRWQLVRTTRSDGRVELDCAPTVVHWLLGSVGEIAPPLIGALSEVAPAPALSNWPVGATARVIKRHLNGEDARVLRVQVIGRSGSGRRTFASAVCAALGREARGVASGAIEDARAAVLLQRQAIWEGFAPVWHGDAPALPPEIDPAPVQFVVSESKKAPPEGERVRGHTVELPTLEFEERRRLWVEMVDGASQWDPGEVDLLAMRNAVQVGDIVDVARCSVDTVEEATRHLSERHAHHLGDLARQMPQPFAWEDLVVPAALRDQLEHLVFEAADRAALFSRPATGRLFPYGRGMAALFHGPPGTGKTMAAQIVARELKLDLYRVDLSALVSKYIGETMSHVRELLDRAAQIDAVLLFDEADALFGKRTDVRNSHDRHANTDTNFLLQALEEFDGVALLASNRRHDLDNAFTRRFRYVLEFDRPDASTRRRLWQRLLEALAGGMEREGLDEQTAVLADQLEMTGAEIKSSILSAVFAARRQNSALSIAHLIEGIERELNKGGGGLSQRERQRLLEVIES